LKSAAARFSRKLAEEHLRDWFKRESAGHRGGGTGRH
jgi:hypothetical protein